MRKLALLEFGSSVSLRFACLALVVAAILSAAECGAGTTARTFRVNLTLSNPAGHRRSALVKPLAQAPVLWFRCYAALGNL